MLKPVSGAPHHCSNQVAAIGGRGGAQSLASTIHKRDVAIIILGGGARGSIDDSGREGAWRSILGVASRGHLEVEDLGEDPEL